MAIRPADRPLRVWIDLANSPHPLLFAPISAALEERGHTVLVTVRDHAQTLELARQCWSRLDKVGGESPGGPIGKARALAARVWALRSWAKAQRPNVALSHNSYAQILAARASGLPVVTAMDFEHQPANHLAFRLADVLLLPEAVPREAVRRQGARDSKVRRYPGLKESIYVGDFIPNPDAPARLGIDRREGEALIVARTPPSRAIYHRGENPLFVEVVAAACRQPGIHCVILPRYPEQVGALQELALPNCLIPAEAIDARALMYESDLVIGAGGTMSREAALLGVPTVSVFAGRQPAVDRWLEEGGALRRLSSVEQLGPVRPRAADPPSLEELRHSGEETLAAFLDAVLVAARDGA
jgi:predicted glycosyltransferase